MSALKITGNADKYALQVNGTSAPIVKFHYDGTVEFNPELTPREGSEEAWRLLLAEAQRGTQQAATVTALQAQVEELLAALRRWQHSGCPDCGGDCSSANPPVMCCIMQETHAALARATDSTGGE